MSFNQEIVSANNPLRTAERGDSGKINVGEIERVACAIAGGALAVYGFRGRTIKGLLLTLAGTALLHRGVTGHCNTYDLLGITTNDTSPVRDTTAPPVARDIHIEKSITIGKSRSELYNFWRDFENLPKFMTHLESVTCVTPNRSHWIAKGPAGTRYEWDAEVYNEKPDELIAWRSLEGEVTNAGSVRFDDAGEHSTVVRVVLNYNAAGGKLSAFVARLLGGEPGQMIEDDLRRLKQILEAGEVASANAHGQELDVQPHVKAVAGSKQ